MLRKKDSSHVCSADAQNDTVSGGRFRPSRRGLFNLPLWVAPHKMGRRLRSRQRGRRILTFPFGEGGPSQTVDEVKGSKQPHPSKCALRPHILPPSPKGKVNKPRRNGRKQPFPQPCHSERLRSRQRQAATCRGDNLFCVAKTTSILHFAFSDPRQSLLARLFLLSFLRIRVKGITHIPIRIIAEDTDTVEPQPEGS